MNRTATTVVHEDDNIWAVQCEQDGCTNAIAVGKRVGTPVNYTDPDAEIVWTVREAPEARRCSSHPPTRHV